MKPKAVATLFKLIGFSFAVAGGFEGGSAMLAHHHQVPENQPWGLAIAFIATASVCLGIGLYKASESDDDSN